MKTEFLNKSITYLLKTIFPLVENVNINDNLVGK